ncbi:MAG: toxin [Spirochaetaceae bacterium]|nr:toxin [Spirochaetaceae bacterium]
MTFNWDDEKNERLKRTRDVSFEEMVIAIEDGNVVDVLQHPNADRYPDQSVYLVEYKDYMFVVPFLRRSENQEIVLKTIYPSRKYTRLYLLKEKDHE